MTAAELAGVPRRLRRLLRRAGRASTATSRSLRRGGDGFVVAHRDRSLAGRATSSSPPAGATGPACPAFAGGLDPDVAQVDAERLPQPGAAPRRPGAGGRGLGHRRAARRRARPRRARGRARRRPPQPGAPPLPRAWTSGGGSTGSAPSPRPSTRSATRRQARHEGALQLVGRADHRDVDLPALQRARRAARRPPRSASTGRASRFADDLAATTAAADERLARLLAPDRRPHRRQRPRAPRCSPATPAPAAPPATARHDLDLRARPASRAVVWATGYRRRYPWLQVPVLDRRGEIVQRRGVTPVARAVRARPAVPAPPRLQLHRRRPPRRRLRRRPHRRPAPPPRARRQP